MNTNVLMAIAIAATTTLTANAQSLNRQSYPGRNPGEVQRVMRPEGFSRQERALDEQQREQIAKIRTEQMKERTQTDQKLNEKRAQLELLQTAEKADMKAIDKAIDEIAALQAQQMKAQAASRQKIRSLLTEEQRIMYDAQNTPRTNTRPKP